MRRLVAALVMGIISGVALAQGGVTIDKRSVHVTHRSFDPSHLPPQMPKLVPPEAADTDGDFLSEAAVGARARQVAADRAELIVSSINIKLNLNITVWLPRHASRRVIDHEEGHRKISEDYYQQAERIARQVATPYLGKVYRVTGPDLHKAADAKLDQIGAQITREYNRRMPVKATQDRYDAITGHGLKDIAVPLAIAQAFKETYPGGAAIGKEGGGA